MVFSHRTRLLTAGLALLLGMFCVSAKAARGGRAAQPAEQGQATSFRVTGNVTDTQGEPLLGAYVALKGDDSVHAITGVDGNYAIDAGLSVQEDALAIEDSESLGAQTYGNVIAVRAGEEETDKTKALVAALQSSAVRTYIEETYGGAVVPLF